MTITKTSHLSPFQSQQIDKLWNEEYPEKLKDRFGVLLEGTDNFQHYLIEDENKKIIAWLVIFEKEQEKRFSIIVDSKHKGKGLGCLLINRLKEEVDEFYGWVIDHGNDKKINGENYRSPLPFYVKQGFKILEDVRIDSEMINAVKVQWGKINER